VASIRFFPRFFCGLFLLYHFYLFSYPAGFHNAAMVSFSAATLSLVLFTLRKMEYPAYMRGDVTIDRPRGECRPSFVTAFSYVMRCMR
jgi:hypothetical protein